MRISEKSWHYKLVHVIGETPNDLCSYFWTLVRNITISAGVIALAIAGLLLVGCLSYYCVIDNNYLVKEKNYVWKDDGTYEIKTNWRLKTSAERSAEKEKLDREKEERTIEEKRIAAGQFKDDFEKKEASVIAENKRDQFRELIRNIGMLLFSITILLYGGSKITKLEDRTISTISAFSIIPAIAATIVIFFYSGFYTYEQLFDLYFDFSTWQLYYKLSIGSCAIALLLHLCCIAILWAIITCAAFIAADALKKKETLGGMDVAVNFVKAKKEKICPLIEYVGPESS